MTPSLAPIVVLAVLALVLISVVFWLWNARERRSLEEQARYEALEQRCQALRDELAETRRNAAAAEGEARALKALLDTLPLPLWRRRVDDLKLDYCNPAYARAVDKTRERALEEQAELLGTGFSGPTRALAERARETGEVQREAFHAVVEGGRRLLRIEERRLSDGRTAGLALDATEQEELKAELDRQRAAHAQVLETVKAGVAIFGADLRLAFFNSSYARLWDLEESILETQPALGDIMEALREGRRLPEQSDFPAYKRDRLRHYQSVIESEEELLHLPDGSTILATVAPHPFGGVVFIYEDVTDRLALESLYNTLLAVRQETLENLFEAVAVFGADGRLKLHNPAFARIWRLSSERLRGEPHVRDLLPELRNFFNASEARWGQIAEMIIARTTEPLARDGQWERADGTVLKWSQVPLPDGASLFTYLDVTDSIRVERALRERNEALETADRLKSEFIANVSYELRTPLNAIIGFAEMLENRYFGPLTERQLEYAHAIAESSQHLTQLINDILDLATIEAGYLELERAPLDVRALLDGVEKLVRERARSRGLNLTLDCPATLGEVVADERRLKQAIFNLLSNAFKFTARGGSVTLSAAQEGDQLRISVRDTGRGIAAEDQERVFEKFERGGSGRHAGAGLGLSLVKSLVELHGGSVELDSRPGQGTVVSLMIPLESAALQSSESRSAARA